MVMVPNSECFFELELLLFFKIVVFVNCFKESPKKSDQYSLAFFCEISGYIIKDNFILSVLTPHITFKNLTKIFTSAGFEFEKRIEFLFFVFPSVR
ncbi:MAG: hypothetical protein JSV93_06795 [Candidatus Omnitrophota bacterium]|nr:MAG: hypothetical protein JSV93_06795 [Candidatus Omnitrophota bacterium]